MLTRKDFLGSVAGLFGIAMLGACGNDEGVEAPTPDAPGPRPDGAGPQPDAAGPQPDAAGPSPDAPAQACTTASTSIGGNHGHTLTISQADLEAGVAKTYNIQGSSGHAHTVMITAAMFTSLKSSGAISVTSSNDAGHTHAVTVTC